MEKLKWFCHDTKYELYSVLYKSENWLLVQNDITGKYSFGLVHDFGTLCGFPVDWSYLSLFELKQVLNEFINIEKRYIDRLGVIAVNNRKRWENMILAAETKIG